MFKSWMKFSVMAAVLFVYMYVVAEFLIPPVISIKDSGLLEFLLLLVLVASAIFSFIAALALSIEAVKRIRVIHGKKTWLVQTAFNKFTKWMKRDGL